MTTPSTEKETNQVKKEYYCVDDGIEGRFVFETIEAAFEYIKECMDGLIANHQIKIEKVEMTENQYNQLLVL